jgi:hypothetical protein|tara:strand:- start:1761 stop:2294 length:534 start_codon:yes stop_codon:yes gene_type:complete
METKGIRVIMIVEVIGKPPKHLIETLENITKQIDEEKGVVVKGKKISEPTPMEKHKGFYMSFAELEMEVEEILQLVILMFKYMPANVEIISPELIALTNNSWGDILSELSRRLHGYDEIARVVQVEKEILEKKLREILEQRGNPLSISLGEIQGKEKDNKVKKVQKKKVSKKKVKKK